MTYFLWSGIFLSSSQVFGYTQEQMFTYVFMLLAVSSIILSAPSADNIGTEIANGDLSNYLVRPVNYLKFWFSRDLSSKLLNLFFASIELSFLWLFLRPIIQLPNLYNFLGFIIICVISLILYFFVNVTIRFASFWMPENTWGMAFLTFVLIETLGGGIFPLDVLPKSLNIILQFTPFPYLLYFPIAIFIGKVTGIEIIRVLIQSILWLLVMYLVMKFVWKKGLFAYSSVGR
jgi:ABC-2 type transport system permease protein